MQNITNYFKVEHKEDVWKIQPETSVLSIECKISLHTAYLIVKHCRELDRIIFSGHAYALTPEEAIDYLRREIHNIQVVGEVRHHQVPEQTAKKIRLLYARGDHNLDTLAAQFNLPKEIIWHIIHEKAPMHIKGARG